MCFCHLEKPATVTVSGYVLDVFDIDETNQEFSLTLYLRHEWKDPRMEFTESEAGTEKILVGKFILANNRHVLQLFL